MEDKKKVKSIESSDNSDFEKEKKKKPAKKSSAIKDAYLKDLEEFDKREVSKMRLKRIFIVLFGIIAIFALLAFFTRNNGSVGIIGNRMKDKGVNGAVAEIYDATVYIENYSGSTVSTTGTGFVYKKDRSKGYILTNYHVVAGSTYLKVTLSDDSKVDAKFVGGDQNTDIAIISISDEDVKKVADFGNSSDVSVGDVVFTVGSPFNNNYRGTVTRGVLSAKDRLTTVSSGNENSTVLKLLETDAVTNPGNSGGPLCNSHGEVIGMITSKLVKENLNGLSFAISIEDIKTRLNSYEKGTSSAKPYMGISMVNLNDSSSMSYYGLSQRVHTNLTNGVVVESVKNNTAASGLLFVGDIIVKLNGADTPDMNSLRYELYKYNISDTIKLRIEREGRMRTVSMILRAKKGT